MKASKSFVLISAGLDRVSSGDWLGLFTIYRASIPLNRLSKERRIQVVKALVEGNSINGIVRMNGVAKNTVLKLLADLGSARLDYQDVMLRNLSLRYPRTPAMAAGLTDHIWEIEEIVSLLDHSN